MPKIKDLLLELAKKVGVENDQELALALSGSGLDAFELPDGVSNKIKGLMSISEAKTFGQNDIDTKNYHIRKFAEGTDEAIIEKAKAFGVSQEGIAELKNIKSSGEMYKRAMELMHDQVEAAKKSKPGNEEYVRQMAEKDRLLKELKETHEKQIGETTAQYNARIQKLVLTGKTNFNWNQAIPEIGRASIYQTAIETEAAALGGKLVFDVDKNDFKLVNVNDESLPLVVEGKEFGYSNLHLLTLQKHKLIGEAAPGGTGGSGNPPGFVPPSGGAGTPKLPSNAASVLKDIDKAFGVFEKSSQ
jgi:hypothetical protein